MGHVQRKMPPTQKGMTGRVGYPQVKQHPWIIPSTESEMVLSRQQLGDQAVQMGLPILDIIGNRDTRTRSGRWKIGRRKALYNEAGTTVRFKDKNSHEIYGSPQSYRQDQVVGWITRRSKP